MEARIPRYALASANHMVLSDKSLPRPSVFLWFSVLGLQRCLKPSEEIDILEWERSIFH